MGVREYHDEYSESLETDFRKLEGALLTDTVKLLAPSEPIRLPVEATVHEALTKMVPHRRAAVVVVDGEGRLIGLMNRLDMLTRVMAERRDPRQTRVGDVMTPEPEALAPNDLISYAINRMHSAGYRTIPLVDADRRPIGIVTANDVVQWLAELFPEVVLNVRPGGQLKHPLVTDAG